MSLTPLQLSTLADMAIPVWEFRSANATETIPVSEENEQLDLQRPWLCLLETTELTAPQKKLLSAMLAAVELSMDDITILSKSHLPLLEQLESSDSYLVIFGKQLAKALLGQAVEVDAQRVHLFNNTLKTVIIEDLNKMLQMPQSKASTWSLLKLTKQ